MEYKDLLTFVSNMALSGAKYLILLKSQLITFGGPNSYACEID